MLNLVLCYSHYLHRCGVLQCVAVVAVCWTVLQWSCCKSACAIQTYIYRHSYTDIHTQTYMYRHTCTDIHIQTFILRHTCTDIHVQTYMYRHTCTDIHIQTFIFRHTCTDIHIQTFIYRHSYTDIHIQTYIYRHTCTDIHIQTYIYRHTCTDIHIQTYIYRHTYTDIHVQTYIYRHTCTDIHTQTYMYRHSYTDIHIQTYRVTTCTQVTTAPLRCVAVCCSVLQCVAVCCSVLQCVAVCCSVAPSQRVLHLQLAHESLLLAQVNTRPWGKSGIFAFLHCPKNQNHIYIYTKTNDNLAPSQSALQSLLAPLEWLNAPQSWHPVTVCAWVTASKNEARRPRPRCCGSCTNTHTHAHTKTHTLSLTHHYVHKSLGVMRRKWAFLNLSLALLPRCNKLQHTATHCNTLQHAAQHTATYCNTLGQWGQNEPLFWKRASPHCKWAPDPAFRPLLRV